MLFRDLIESLIIPKGKFWLNSANQKIIPVGLGYHHAEVVFDNPSWFEIEDNGTTPKGTYSAIQSGWIRCDYGRGSNITFDGKNSEAFRDSVLFVCASLPHNLKVYIDHGGLGQDDKILTAGEIVDNMSVLE